MRASKQRLILLAAIALLAMGQVRADLYDKGGALGSGARAMAMGGAYTALAQNEDALWWNPAGLGEVSMNRVESSLGSVYNGSVRTLELAGAMPLPKQVVAGLGWRHQFYPQPSQVNTDELLLAGSIPLDEGRQWHLGMGIKLLFGEMVSSGLGFSGLGMDFGLRYNMKLFEHYQLILGAHVQDIDTRITWENQQEQQVPSRLALGAGFVLDPKTMFSLDLESVSSTQDASGSTQLLRLGAEHWVADLFALRAGLVTDNHQVSALSFGFGFNVAQMEVEYALTSTTANMGVSHRLSLSYGLPRLVLEAKPAVLAAPEEFKLPEMKPETFEFELVVLPESFSPNGDGLADTAIIHLDLIKGFKAEIASWSLSIFDEQGNNRRTFTGRGYPPEMEWDGADKTGKICADGYYTLVMEVTDRDRKKLAPIRTKVQIKTNVKPITMALNRATFERISGKLESPLVITFPDGAGQPQQSWSVEIRNQQGQNMRVFKGQGLLPNQLVWNGTVKRKPVADGSYQVIFTVSDPSGLRIDNSELIQFKSIAPQVGLGVAPAMIRPGFKKNGKATFTLTTNYNQDIRQWRLVIQNRVTKKTVRTYRGRGSLPAKLVWPGTNNRKRHVAGGRYLGAHLTVTYKGKVKISSPTVTLSTDVVMPATTQGLALHLASVNFDPGSSVIPLDAYKMLNQAINTIKRYARNYRVQVKGHTDNVESPTEAIELSWQRALKVKAYLNVSGKIPITLIDAVGYGDRLPLAPNDNSAGRGKNRRVEIVVIIGKK